MRIPREILFCEVCEEQLSKYSLDRWSDTICSNRCAGQAYGRQEGAAVVFGLLGMAEAIRNNPSLEACPVCLKAKGSWVICASDDTYHWFYHGKMCWSCYELESARQNRKSPYR